MNDNETRFHGATVLITGGGNGIGRETAVRFAAEGATVACVDLQVDAAQETVSFIEAAGGSAFAFGGDVTDDESVANFVGSAAEAMGSISVLVNNAGGGALLSMSDGWNAWQRQLDYNLLSVVRVSLGVWPHMVARGGGVILCAASVAARWALPSLGAYCASKAGVVALVRSMAQEGAPLGIRANCVVPGNVLTSSFQAYLDQAPDPIAARATADRSAALGRLGTPRDIAEAYLFLASDAAAWITGTDLLIDGGFTLGDRPAAT